MMNSVVTTTKSEQIIYGTNVTNLRRRFKSVLGVMEKSSGIEVAIENRLPA